LVLRFPRNNNRRNPTTIMGGCFGAENNTRTLCALAHLGPESFSAGPESFGPCWRPDPHWQLSLKIIQLTSVSAMDIVIALNSPGAPWIVSIFRLALAR
jgi:hypothetical protein